MISNPKAKRVLDRTLEIDLNILFHNEALDGVISELYKLKAMYDVEGSECTFYVNYEKGVPEVSLAVCKTVEDPIANLQKEHNQRRALEMAKELVDFSEDLNEETLQRIADILCERF